jgi:hypothetical protein
LVRAANEAVSTWSPKDAAFSYKTYAQFQNAASSAQSDYLSAIGKLLSGS